MVHRSNKQTIRTKMRYSIEPRERRFVKGYGFMSFARNFSDKYSKSLMDKGMI